MPGRSPSFVVVGLCLVVFLLGFFHLSSSRQNIELQAAVSQFEERIRSVTYSWSAENRSFSSFILLVRLDAKRCGKDGGNSQPTEPWIRRWKIKHAEETRTEGRRVSKFGKQKRWTRNQSARAPIGQACSRRTNSKWTAHGSRYLCDLFIGSRNNWKTSRWYYRWTNQQSNN